MQTQISRITWHHPINASTGVGYAAAYQASFDINWHANVRRSTPCLQSRFVPTTDIQPVSSIFGETGKADLQASKVNYLPNSGQSLELGYASDVPSTATEVKEANSRFGRIAVLAIATANSEIRSIVVVGYFFVIWVNYSIADIPVQLYTRQTVNHRISPKSLHQTSVVLWHFRLKCGVFNSKLSFQLFVNQRENTSPIVRS